MQTNCKKNTIKFESAQHVIDHYEVNEWIINRMDQLITISLVGFAMLNAPLTTGVGITAGIMLSSGFQIVVTPYESAKEIAKPWKDVAIKTQNLWNQNRGLRMLGKLICFPLCTSTLVGVPITFLASCSLGKWLHSQGLQYFDTK